jgi:hypothetical protein
VQNRTQDLDYTPLAKMLPYSPSFCALGFDKFAFGLAILPYNPLAQAPTQKRLAIASLTLPLPELMYIWRIVNLATFI